jgi:TonB family protein
MVRILVHMRHASRIFSAVKKNWYALVPPSALAPTLKQGCLVIEFKIRKDGALQPNPQLAFTSGDVDLDRAAYEAITSTSPFPPLPAEFKGESLSLRFSFLYNPISPGRVLSRAQPNYPKEAKKHKAHGPVVLEATIEINGDVISIGIKSGDLLLADAAVDAARSWKFQPYTCSGKPVRALQTLTFDFDPREKKAVLAPLRAAVPMHQSCTIPNTHGRANSSSG